MSQQLADIPSLMMITRGMATKGQGPHITEGPEYHKVSMKLETDPRRVSFRFFIISRIIEVQRHVRLQRSNHVKKDLAQDSIGSRKRM